MTSHVCTEESRESVFNLIDATVGFNNATDKTSGIYVETLQRTNYGDLNETTPLSREANLDNMINNAGPTTDLNYATKLKAQRKSSPCWKKSLLGLIVIFIVALVGFSGWIFVTVEKLKEPKSSMLYRPTSEYLENLERPQTIKWCLVEEHSRSPFTQVNATHLLITANGFYHISCSLLMQTNHQNVNVITLLIFYSNGAKSVYTKKTWPTGFSRFSLQQTIVLHLKQGDYFYVQVIPPKYLMQDPTASYLSISQQ